MIDPKETICVHKWGFPVVDFFNKKYKLCCNNSNYRTINDNDTFDSILNSDYEKQRRLEMLQGIKHHDCIKCWKIEEIGAVSPRIRQSTLRPVFEEYYSQTLNEEFGTTDLMKISNSVNINSKILTATDMPYRLEIKLGSLCDLHCIYCYNNASTQWALTDLKDGIISKERYTELTRNVISNEYSDNFWKWIKNSNKDNMRYIAFTGGEPTLSPEFYNQVDLLLFAFNDVPDKKIICCIVTNGNTPKKKYNKFIEYLTKLSKKFIIHLYLSVEAIENQAEFIRTNLKWQTFENNLHTSMTSGLVDELFLGSAWNNISIPRLIKFLQWHKTLIEKYDKMIMISRNIVTGPEYFSPFILPANFTKHIDKCLEFVNETTYPDALFKQNFLDFLNVIKTGISASTPCSNETLINFYIHINKTSNYLGVNFEEIFPEMIDFYNNCKFLYLEKYNNQ